MADEMRDLIARITEEALKRINMPDEKTGGTLAVCSGYVFDEETIVDYIGKNHKNVTYALLDDTQFGRGDRIDSRQEKERLAGKLKEYESILVITPPLWLVGAIARGDDSIYTAMLILRPLLWGREVKLLLDFESPKSRRSPAFLKLGEDIRSLEEMGIKVAYLNRECKTGEELKELVTEQDVKDAGRSEAKRVRIKPGAIVTQLAQDTAKELGVIIGASSEL